MFDLFVWIFEHGLLLFTVILLLYVVMFYYEFFEKAAKFFGTRHSLGISPGINRPLLY